MCHEGIMPSAESRSGGVLHPKSMTLPKSAARTYASSGLALEAHCAPIEGARTSAFSLYSRFIAQYGSSTPEICLMILYTSLETAGGVIPRGERPRMAQTSCSMSIRWDTETPAMSQAEQACPKKQAKHEGVSSMNLFMSPLNKDALHAAEYLRLFSQEFLFSDKTFVHKALKLTDLLDARGRRIH